MRNSFVEKLVIADATTRLTDTDYLNATMLAISSSVDIGLDENASGFFAQAQLYATDFYATVTILASSADSWRQATGLYRLFNNEHCLYTYIVVVAAKHDSRTKTGLKTRHMRPRAALKYIIGGSK